MFGILMNYINFYLKKMRIYFVIIINVRRMEMWIQCKYDEIFFLYFIFDFFYFQGST
jgi:hypothetical protein